LQYCEDKNLDAYIPNFGQYKPEREGFIYNAEKEQYECIQVGGNKAVLPFKGIRTDSKGYTKKTFRSSESDCKNCPLREQCCGKVYPVGSRVGTIFEEKKYYILRGENLKS
jgi:hypothetical protein